jgi:phosphoribosylglycinamide formyltransferase-1
LQAKVPVFSGDSCDDLSARVHEQEHRIYPLVVKWFIEKRLSMQGDNAVLDGNILPSSGYAAD